MRQVLHDLADRYNRACYKCSGKYKVLKDQHIPQQATMQQEDTATTDDDDDDDGFDEDEIEMKDLQAPASESV